MRVLVLATRRKSTMSSASRQEKKLSSKESDLFYSRKPTMPPRPKVPSGNNGLEARPSYILPGIQSYFCMASMVPGNAD